MSVDVYSSGDSTTTAIAQNVNVLDTSVGNSGALTSGDNGWVTLAVEPDKVQEIIAASNKTTLYFTLPGEAVPSGSADSQDKADDAGGGDADEGAEADADTDDADAAPSSSASKSSSSKTSAENASGGDR